MVEKMKILSYIYYLITSFRNFLYDKGLLPIYHVKGVEIICIGNISVGGTGKTPAVPFFFKKFKKMGKNVAVFSLGYFGKRKIELCLFRDGGVIFVSPPKGGDVHFILFLTLTFPIFI